MSLFFPVEDELLTEVKPSKEGGRKQVEGGHVATPPLPLEDNDTVTNSRGKSPDDVITQLEGESPGEDASSPVESESSEEDSTDVEEESSSTDVEGEVFFNGPDEEVSPHCSLAVNSKTGRLRFSTQQEQM